MCQLRAALLSASPTLRRRRTDRREASVNRESDWIENTNDVLSFV